MTEHATAFVELRLGNLTPDSRILLERYLSTYLGNTRLKDGCFIGGPAVLMVVPDATTGVSTNGT